MSQVNQTNKPAVDTAPRLAVVVVTFNRKRLLLECLQGLLAQTRLPDRIYIIDNASTDGTLETLRQSGYLGHHLIQYISLGKNRGGAGGFSAGLKAAYADGYDWFWLMDDDVEPYPDGLAQLLEFRHASGCIHGRRRNADGTPFVWIEHFSERTITTKRIADPLFLMNRDTQTINTGCFEGMLVSRDVVSKIGFPDPDFFITWDDTYYGYLASLVTDVLYVDAFVLKRKLSIGTVESRMCGARFLQSQLALFYSHRNRWLIAKQLRTCRFPFLVASARFVIRALFREIFLVRSLSRSLAVLTGALEGMQYRVNKRPTLCGVVDSRPQTFSTSELG
jgi:rhamnopyranosyl-N-acetylglucosaminyl-diphospho-decaprenol beta-1,3/1,4-galactofuranosyltransferase